MPNSKDVTLMGVINMTPDSMSDGGEFLDPKDALKQAKKLIKQGASIIDIGGQASGPGSIDCGAQQEWERIEKSVSSFQKLTTVSVDTYRYEVAKSSLEAGALLINDITAGEDIRTLALIAEQSDSQLILMHNNYPLHSFKQSNIDLDCSDDPVSLIIEYLQERITRACSEGVARSQLVIDPGMGRFLSEVHDLSYLVLEEFYRFAELELPVVLAASRKGFLGGEGLAEKDSLSAQIASQVLAKWPENIPLYIRAHNIEAHQAMLM